MYLTPDFISIPLCLCLPQNIVQFPISGSIISFLNLRIPMRQELMKVNLFPTRVNIHLEKFNRRFNLLHIGISFDDSKRKVRFDYRSYYNNYNTYVKKLLDDNIDPFILMIFLRYSLMNDNEDLPW